MPNLRVLDFQKVKLKEKLMAKNLFESEKGKQLIDDMINKRFKEENDYAEAVENILKDEENKRKIYVNAYLIIELNSRYRDYG
jgi:hypothetical protein